MEQIIWETRGCGMEQPRGGHVSELRIALRV